AIDDLQHAAFVRTVAEIDTVGLRTERDHAVQLGRHRAGRPRLLPDQAEQPDPRRMRRVAEIDHLGHAPRSPAFYARDQVSDAGVAFPEAFVRVLQIPARTRHELRRRWIGDVPDLMTLLAERAQQIDSVRIALG